MKKIIHTLYVFVNVAVLPLVVQNVHAQSQAIGSLKVDDGTNSTTYNKDALAHFQSNSKGLLLPRIALTATNSASPLNTFTAGMTVYNTATAGTAPNNVIPGYYYSDGTQWIKLATNAWSLTGNASTIDGTNFIGTTDNVPFNIRVNNQKAGRIDNTLSNTFLGYLTAVSNTGSFNTAIGDHAFYNNTAGNLNIAIGYQSLSNQNFNNGGAVWNADNVAIGYKSLYSNQPTATTNGIQNTAVGDMAGNTNTTGAANTYVGYNATGSATLTNATAIGANASVTASNSLVLGNGVNVGIGTTAPSTTLHVQSTTSPGFRLVDGTQAAGKVLTSDANGNASWQTPAGSAGAGSTVYTNIGSTRNPAYVNTPVTDGSGNNSTTCYNGGSSITLPGGSKYLVTAQFGFVVSQGTTNSWRYVSWSYTNAATVTQSSVWSVEHFVGGEYTTTIYSGGPINYVVSGTWIIDLTSKSGNVPIYFYQRDMTSTKLTQTGCCDDQYTISAMKIN